MPLKPLLFLSPRLPWPLLTGARIRTHALLTALRRRFDVHYAGFLEPGADAAPGAREYLDGLNVVHLAPERALTRPGKALLALTNLAGRKPATVSKYWDRALARAVWEWIAAHPGAIVHADHLHMAPYLDLAQPWHGRLARDSRGITGETPVPQPAALRVIDEHNVESVIVERMAGECGNPLLRLWLGMQARRMRRLEGELAGRAGLTLAVSAGDAAELTRMAPGARIKVIPNGVDLEYFSPPAEGRAPQPGRLIFTGSMNWLPNEDAVLFFVNEVMPKLNAKSISINPQSEFPRFSLDIVGHAPSAAVKDLADNFIRVTGTVPDVRPFMNEAEIYIVPLRVGGGSRLKILEAFAMEIPVVSTAVGCEGLDVTDREQLLIADTPEDFAAAVLRLAGDGELRRALAERAKKHVVERFGWASIGAKLVELYNG